MSSSVQLINMFETAIMKATFPSHHRRRCSKFNALCLKFNSVEMIHEIQPFNTILETTQSIQQACASNMNFLLVATPPSEKENFAQIQPFNKQGSIETQHSECCIKQVFGSYPKSKGQVCLILYSIREKIKKTQCQKQDFRRKKQVWAEDGEPEISIQLGLKYLEPCKKVKLTNRHQYDATSYKQPSTTSKPT